MASTATAEVTGLGIAQDKDGRGMDALTHRRIIGAMWESCGIVTGLDVTANPGKGMSWHVSEGVVVVSRGEADGKVEAYWPGGDVTGEPGGSGYRLDTIWIRQLDAAQGDASNRVEVGITPGTGATDKMGAEPGELPAGAEILTYVLISPGQAQSSDEDGCDGMRPAALRGVSQGVIGGTEWLNTTNYRKVRKGESWTFATNTLTIGTRYRQVLVMLAVSVWAADCETVDWLGSGYVELLVDGRVEQCFKFTCTPYVTETKTFFWNLMLNKGTHTVSARLWGSGSDAVSSVVTQYEAGAIPGQYMRVIDLGWDGD